MSTITHPFTPEEIMVFVDGEFSSDRAQSISSHLDQCAECSQLASQLRGASQALTQWQVDEFSASVQKRILSEASSAPPISPGGPKLFPRLRILISRPLPWAVGCLALLAFVSTQLFSRRPVASERYMGLSPKYKSEIAPPAGPGASRVLRGSDSTKLLANGDKVSNGNAYTFVEGHTANDAQIVPMIARTASLSVVVKDFDVARRSLDAILARHNGYAAELNVATPQGSARTIQASLRIPATQLVAAIAELKALGRVENETQNGEEVTQQHADLVARLKNSRETEQRLQDVLRTRTGKVKDVLEVEQEIARVRGEIEQMEAEQQTLEHRVNFATIDLKLAEEYKAQLSSPAPSVGMQLRNATVNGFRNASESLLGIILFFAEFGPTLLLWLLFLSLPAWLLWRRYRRSLAMGSSLVG
jgi:hypothetical protein